MSKALPLLKLHNLRSSAQCTPCSHVRKACSDGAATWVLYSEAEDKTARALGAADFVPFGTDVGDSHAGKATHASPDAAPARRRQNRFGKGRHQGPQTRSVHGEKYGDYQDVKSNTCRSGQTLEPRSNFFQFSARPVHHFCRIRQNRSTTYMYRDVRFFSRRSAKCAGDRDSAKLSHWAA